MRASKTRETPESDRPRIRGFRGLGLAPVLAIALVQPAPATQDLDTWRWRAALSAPSAPIVAVELSPSLLDGCSSSSLADLRLADEQGVVIPYALVRGAVRRIDRELVGRALDRDRPDADTSRVTLDFGGDEIKNQLTVRTAGSSFRRAVRVEGSHDRSNWSGLLESGWLHAVGVDRPRYETLALGANTYRYLRVSVRRMPEESAPPDIEEVVCRHELVTTPAARRQELGITSVEHDAALRRSSLEVDVGHRHQNLVELELVLDRDPGRIYRRTVHVHGRDSVEHVERIRFETGELGAERVVETPWTFLGTATIARDVGGADALAIRLPMPNHYLRLDIEDGDGPPLEFVGVVGTFYPVHLVFEPYGGTQFALYAGRDGVAAPDYEAQSVLADLDPAELPQATLSEPLPLASPDTPPGEGDQQIVWLLMAAAFLATAGLLWRTASRPSGAEPADAAPGAPGAAPPAS